MAATTGKIGLGATLEMGDGGGSEVFAAVANVVSITGPGEKMDTVDVTHLGSTGGYREFLPHLKDGGEVTFECHFDPTHATQNDSTGLRSKYSNRTKTNFRLNWYGAGIPFRDSFAAYVTALGKATPVDNVVKMDVTLKISGPVTEEASSS